MSEHGDWELLRERRLAEEGGAEAYDAARLDYELGRTAREPREQRD